MMYTIGKLAKLAGVTTRTLRHYEAIGLLFPDSINESGYRLYGTAQVDSLQQILFYRALGVELKTIKSIMDAPEFKRTAALEGHLRALLEKRQHIDVLIENARKSIASAKGETVMTDKEKFEGLKKKLIEENEKQYGQEARALYGDAVDASNQKMMDMTPQQFEKVQMLEKKVGEKLSAALETKDPASKAAQEACELHKQWLQCFWKDYSKEAHLGIAQMYVADSRFAAYYEKFGKGCAQFLYDALCVYCR